MKLNLATWNMDWRGHKQHLKEAWKYFIEELGCDILLSQESKPSEGLLNAEGMIWSPIGGTRPWGSGIYSPNYKIEEYPYIQTSRNNFRGSVTVAEVEVTTDLNLILISLYGLLEKISTVGYSITNLHRIFSDLTGILELGDTKNRVIIGGDFNASLQIDDLQPGESHRVFFDRLEQFGLVNCFEGYFDDFVQTLRHGRSEKPWQNDYFFISKKLESKLVDCRVIDNDSVCKFSDHNPVIISLEI